MAKVEMGCLEYPLASQLGVLVAAVIVLWGVVEYFGFESAYQQQYRDPYLIAAQTAKLEGFLSTGACLRTATF